MAASLKANGLLSNTLANLVLALVVVPHLAQANVSTAARMVIGHEIALLVTGVISVTTAESVVTLPETAARAHAEAVLVVVREALVAVVAIVRVTALVDALTVTAQNHHAKTKTRRTIRIKMTKKRSVHVADQKTEKRIKKKRKKRTQTRRVKRKRIKTRK